MKRSIGHCYINEKPHLPQTAKDGAWKCSGTWIFTFGGSNDSLPERHDDVGVQLCSLERRREPQIDDAKVGVSLVMQIAMLLFCIVGIA